MRGTHLFFIVFGMTGAEINEGENMIRSRSSGNGLGLLLAGAVVACFLFGFFPERMYGLPEMLGREVGAIIASFSPSRSADLGGRKEQPEATLWAVAWDGRSVPIKDGARLTSSELPGFLVSVNPAIPQQGAFVLTMAEVVVDGKTYFADDADEVIRIPALRAGPYTVIAKGTFRVCTQSGCGDIIPFEPLSVKIEVR